jgi:hypothetical protein
MDQAYYSATIARFLLDAPESILGQLAEHHPHDLVPMQRHASGLVKSTFFNENSETVDLVGSR